MQATANSRGSLQTARSMKHFSFFTFSFIPPCGLYSYLTSVIIRENGWKGLFRGITAVASGAGPHTISFDQFLGSLQNHVLHSTCTCFIVFMLRICQEAHWCQRSRTPPLCNVDVRCCSHGILVWLFLSFIILMTQLLAHP